MHNSRNHRSLSLNRIWAFAFYLNNNCKLIVKRTNAGLAAARAQGRTGGRRPALSPEQAAQINRLIKHGHTRKQLAIIYNVSLSTVYKFSPVSIDK
ncbi:Hin recombinase [Salmonella enterica]|nr:Hin recombinase [Salmonella enterica]